MQITCHQCGTQNDFGRVFCIKCGLKLDFEKAERKLHSMRRGRHRSSLWRWARGLLLMGLAGIGGLAFWPVPPTGAVGAKEQAESFRSKIFLLEEALVEKRAASAEFSEEEVNAHLAQMVRYTQSQTTNQSMWSLRLDGINMAFRSEQCVLLVTVSRPPVVLTYELTLVPTAKKSLLQGDIQNVRWGHLPIPAPTSKWLVDRISQVLFNMKREKAVLDHSEGRPAQGKILLEVRSS